MTAELAPIVDDPGVRPRRSVLYVPGSNPRALEKAATLPADAFILDLEDAVAPDAKFTSRENVLEILARGGFGDRERAVRVNGLDTAWGADDLRALAAGPRPDALVLPKIESAETVVRARALWPDPPPIWCMIETPRGVLDAEHIAAAPGVAGLVMGTSDLSKELRVAPHPERLPLLFSLSRVLLAARAAGVFALDGVCLDLESPDAFEREAAQGVALGFDGKTLIHPKTIAAANRIFAPSPEEVAAAERVVEAFERAQAAEQGVVVVDGRLVEGLHVEAARRRVALAAAVGRRDAGG